MVREVADAVGVQLRRRPAAATAEEQPAPERVAITAMYSVPDDAWYLGLVLVRDQRTLVTTVVPDEDPAREPTVGFHGRHLDIPYEVMRWFMDRVGKEIRTSRAWMQLRPERVEVIHRLRQEHQGAVADKNFPQVLAQVRAAVSGTDVPAVLVAAFGESRRQY
ncbi:hypothetical protein OG298_02465 [Streptomyces sp. NBC_01005]|uniref:hypothetical protein n=1 Tax=unclassified Streptomyces TaxID=2593676 RepID=UPI002E38247C|nr:hypothetical protein [Streptomyces sp. NBC_01362]WSW03306.1 hypothetical protein OG298_02465 [Streptomyces sp. NBC_01005]WTC92808.1 hypothetical protein OH736_02450 [Streptomyces sp. NBC_01650]